MRFTGVEVNRYSEWGLWTDVSLPCLVAVLLTCLDVEVCTISDNCVNECTIRSEASSEMTAIKGNDYS